MRLHLGPFCEAENTCHLSHWERERYLRSEDFKVFPHSLSPSAVPDLIRDHYRNQSGPGSGPGRLSRLV